MARDVTRSRARSTEPRGSTTRVETGMTSGDRLDSWKEIAAYLRRDIRTVHRWEADEGLPIHRHLHRTRATVWAYSGELDAWRDNRQPKRSGDRPIASSPSMRPGAPSPGHIRVAVLPFQNLTGPDDEYFSDGLTEELISCLCRVAGDRLAVIARTSVLQYKRSVKSVERIGRELDVSYILEGSVRRSGRRLAITAQLIRVDDQTHMWAESYDRNLSDVLTIQNDVARAVTSRMAVSMNPVRRVARPGPVRPEAYEAHLKGLYHRNRFTKEGFDKALAYHERAVHADPSHALTWAGLALAHAMVSHCDLPARQPREAFARVERAARRALELDDTLADAQLAQAELKLYYEWDWTAAGDALDRALALNPNMAEAYRHRGWYALLVGRPDEALRDLRKAKELEPVAPLYTAELGWMHLARDEYDQAADEALQALELDEDFPVARFVLGFVALQQGKVDEAIAAHRRAVRTGRGWQWALGYTLAVSGRTREARKMMRELGDQAKPADAWKAWTLACVAVGLGDTERACAALAAAFDLRHSWMPWVDLVPMFAPLHADLRFRQLVHRLDLPRASRTGTVRRIVNR